MLSGVGPADHLKQHGIAVLHDLPGVGERLTDHPVVDIRFKDKVGLSTNFIKPAKISHLRPWKLITSVYEYFVKGKGPLASNVSPPFKALNRTNRLEVGRVGMLHPLG